jgi:L-histidine N-alpha-methyltransferase
MLSTTRRSALLEATAAGLQAETKELPAVWLYDERGSRLYNEITELPDYYLPRREAEILRVQAAEIAERTRAETLIELGGGGARNTRYLLDALPTLRRFVAFDVSEQMLGPSTEAIADEYPRISVEALIGDFERDLDALPTGERRLIALLGSTIGNLFPARRARLLQAAAGALGEHDAFLVGIDLVKDAARLEAAYNDATGVTEAFVRNALTAVNRELGATFDQARFAYDAHWNSQHEWMDIGLRAHEAHNVSVPVLELELSFDEGERLRVEISSKFRRQGFEREALSSGLRLEAWWTDRAGDFAVALFKREETA